MLPLTLYVLLSLDLALPMPWAGPMEDCFHSHLALVFLLKKLKRVSSFALSTTLSKLF
jgi:hypothetical protein